MTSLACSVSISGNYAIVGAPNEAQDASGTNSKIFAGSAYIFERNATTGNWSQQQKLVASDRERFDNFGYSVAISGDYAIVGAAEEDEDAAATPADSLSNAGSAYVFERTGTGVNPWTQAQKLVASDRSADDEFGTSVSISGDYAIVGAPYEDEDAAATPADSLSNAGSAYILREAAQAGHKHKSW